jgi:hypothetical protein
MGSTCAVAMIEVYAFSQLKKITEKACVKHEFEAHVFDTHNKCHAEWIKPCVADRYYQASVMYQFSAGTESQFEAWRESLCLLCHKCSLRDFLAVCTPNNYFYVLLTCSSVETFLGSTVCKSLYEDFVKFWPHLSKLHCGDLEAAQYFISRYLEWQHASWVASKRGCLEFG